ncbi:hypothetical protein EES39_12540 [Streptomyces sp. ADI92-24]|uniref:hypothetical protein n=1 Tax=unclassified Streptomyces TaxID=2593676 RepID=UPI000F4AE59D|nr:MULTISPECIES: hypothetical protein [unclassified Streptomyces]ROQ81553.1 hypothetical protein EDD95_1134 [Streptomyces sp. CEV 2-1]RPK47111.1 hypothetical protein EES39_12540 [Streptomyces sp. ADI92-24]
MPRSQWCCLVAALAVVLGLFCGQSTAARTAVTAPVRAAAVVASPVPVPGPVPAVAVATDSGDRVPGCGRGGKREGGEPAVPGRARGAQDQAPGLAEWGLPVATGPGPVRPPAPTALRGPDAAAPGPVELSVLRV